jgi:hypothetical protein
MAAVQPFVVKEPHGDVEVVRAQLAELAEVKPLTEDLVLVTPRETDGDRSAWWERIRDAVESAEWVAPVVVDEQGRESYPTGAVAIRFQEAPSDEELEELAAEYGLRLLRRNQYVSVQVAFAPAEPRETFLPDLVDRIEGNPRVRAAWPVTTSRYERVDSR